MSAVGKPKEFTIERRLRMMAGKGLSEYDAQITAVDQSGVSNAEILDAINLLREEISHFKAAASAPVAGPNSDAEEDIRQEVAYIIKSISQAKAEIAAIKHPFANEDRLGKASKQLDAIVEATETATHDILLAAEEIERVLAEAAEADPKNEAIASIGADVGGLVVKILEACSFQDITGQRVTKVIKTISYIEERILSVIDIWGIEAFEGFPIIEDHHEDDALLEGPQFENQGISQADIDALFA